VPGLLQMLDAGALRLHPQPQPGELIRVRIAAGFRDHRCGSGGLIRANPVE